MIRPETLIVELLLRHNCVIIPGFGGFVAQRVSAVTDYANGLMLPPKKALLFNRQLMNNDGLLTSELAKQAAIPFSEASKLILEMVQNWHSELAKGAHISIDKVGFLFFDTEKNLCFEQDKFFNLLLESFGLSNVHFSIYSEKGNSLAQEVDNLVPNPAEMQNLHAVKRATWKYLAAACILPIAFYSFWIPVKTNVLESGMFSVKDFNPFIKTKTTAYKRKKLPTVRFRYTYAQTNFEQESFEFAPGIVFSCKKNTTGTPDGAFEKNSSLGRDASKQVIVGCFVNQVNVENMLNLLKSIGLDGYIYDKKNDITRISAGGSEKDSVLRKIREQLLNLGLEAWILNAKK
jgi:hypothetical protein